MEIWVIIIFVLVVALFVIRCRCKEHMSTEVRYEMALELDKLIRNQQQRALSMSRDDVERYLGEKASEFDAEAWYIFRRNLAKGREGMVKELIGRGN